MPRTIITTCGTSLLKSCCWKYRGVYKNAIPLSSSMEKNDIEKKELNNNISLKMAFKKSLNPGEVVKEDFYPLETGFYKQFWEDPEYIRNLPAELASLKAISSFYSSDPDSSEIKDKICDELNPLGKGDEIILLPSDTEEGLFCAKIIYNVLKNEDYNLLPGVHIENPERWRQIGLDPTKEEFRDAVENVWKDCKYKFKRSENKEYIFNLTGGYKGLGFLLSAFAYAKGNDSKIFYLFEETYYKKILMMCFDPNKSDGRFSELNVKLVPVTKKPKNRSHLPDCTQ